MLNANDTEAEPNDEQHEAKIIRLAEGSTGISVSGQLGGACDIDQFAIEVPEGASIRAQLLDPSGNPCDASLPSVEMSLGNRLHVVTNHTPRGIDLDSEA